MLALLLTSLGTLDAQMHVHLATDTTEYARSQPIHMRLVAANSSSGPVLLQFMTAQRYDFEIRDESGEPRWRWSDGRGFAQLLGEHALPAEGTLEYEETFTGSLPAGRYTVIGWITATDQTLRAQGQFSVR